MDRLTPDDYTAAIGNPTVLAAIRRYQEMGELIWEPMPPDELEPTPQCAVCGDTGLVAAHRDDWAVPEYLDCGSCGSQRVLRARRHRLQADVPARFRKAMLAVLPGSEMAVHVWEKVAALTSGSLWIGGPIGSGKTYLATAYYWRRCDSGEVKSARWWSVPELLDAIRDSYRHPDQPNPVVWAKTCDLLLLDDLGAERLTAGTQEFVQEALYGLVSARHDNMRDTIVTTNYTQDLLAERLGDRIVSRLVGMCKPHIHWLDQPDLRVRK